MRVRTGCNASPDHQDVLVVGVDAHGHDRAASRTRTRSSSGSLRFLNMQQAKMGRLMSVGLVGQGTIKAIHDTGMFVNNQPQSDIELELKRPQSRRNTAAVGRASTSRSATVGYGVQAAYERLGREPATGEKPAHAGLDCIEQHDFTRISRDGDQADSTVTGKPDDLLQAVAVEIEDEEFDLLETGFRVQAGALADDGAPCAADTRCHPAPENGVGIVYPDSQTVPCASHDLPLGSDTPAPMTDLSPSRH